MKKVIVWGLGKEYRHYCNIINSKEILKENKKNEEYEIIGYCDKEKRNIEKYVSPDEVFILNPDLIITSMSLKLEINNIICQGGINIPVKSFNEFIDECLWVHPQAVDNGMGIDRYLRIIDERTTIKVKNFIEIGANYGQDSEYCRLIYGLPASCIYAFEANPVIANNISRQYRFNNYNLAVYNYDGTVRLHAISEEERNSGISTVADYDYARVYETVNVECVRMDTFLKKHSEIGYVNFVQIDAEGVGYEVLEGFGESLQRVQCIEIEAEHITGFRGQHLFFEIAVLLEKNGFELIDYILHDKCTQSDSMWVRKELIKRI